MVKAFDTASMELNVTELSDVKCLVYCESEASWLLENTEKMITIDKTLNIWFSFFVEISTINAIVKIVISKVLQA